MAEGALERLFKKHGVPVPKTRFEKYAKKRGWL